ncbi:LysR family transcriptional regulator [Oceanobacillus halotolerans]|uniref:LysR family transcriptional regulator n=1 Tax=Oceanobacillus halotolerans TaxID=2663380 RepID=UPI0013DC0DA1|nr:LysR family transcriptional regulator [Oceanobacillus halotolerans]
MDIRQLRYFIAIANAGSYSIAAKNLFVTQPTLSWTVQKLESDLNTKLFYHADHGIELTENGKILFEYGKNIVKDIDDLTKQIRENNNVVGGSLKVGLTVLLSMRYMQSISEFMSSHSHYEITLIQKGSKRIQEMVSTGELDLGLVSFPVYYDNLEVEPCASPFPSYDVSVFVSKENLLSTNKKLKLKDLASEKFSILTCDFTLGNLIYDRCKEVGFEPHVVFQNENWEVLLENVALTDNVTILPTELVKNIKPKDVKSIKLDDKIGKINIGFVKRKHEKLSQPNLLFCQAIKQGIQAQQKISK